MYSEIAANKRKSWLIFIGFFAVIGLLAYFISQYFFGETYITVFVLVFAAIYALIGYFAGGKMAVAMHGAKEIEEQDNPRFYRIVENLTITVGMPMPKVYIIEDPAMNAFATGRNPEHAIVAATSGLINELDDAELEGVMAHELGHVKNYDIRVSLLAFALVSVAAIISDILLRSVIWGGSNNRDRGGIVVLIGLAFAVLTPITAKLLQLAISRQREYLADATGALTTRYPEGLASALEKIGKKGSSLKRQNTATAHLFFSNPLKRSNASRFFSTHPPIEDRVQRLRDMGGNL